MSLNGTDRAQASQELMASYNLAGLSRDEIQHDLGFTPQQLERALAVRPTSDPAQMWLLRDYLDRAIRDRGRKPAGYTVLTDTARVAASQGLRLRPAPAATRKG